MSKLEEIALGGIVVLCAILLGAGLAAIGAKIVIGVLLLCSLLYVVGFLSRDHRTAKPPALPPEERKSEAEK